MINTILKYPLFYRSYQRIVRAKYSEYDLFRFVFSNLSKKKKIRMLDICCGDSFVLNHVSDYITDYLGVDNNEKYLNPSKKKWKKFKFKNLDLSDKKSLKYLKKFKPNLIFMNGVIHHLDDDVISSINFFIKNLKKNIFISVDPIKENNKIINKIMILLDRGKFIRNKSQYRKIMKGFKTAIIDDFYQMSFKNIFHFKNFDLAELYKKWVKSTKF
jgi:ubiquinone/menaquinone biosynthesis C-methylase UbiE